MNMDDRRTHQRLNEQNSVAVRILSAPEADALEGKTYFCTTEDLSAGGLRFNVSAPVPVGTVMEIRVAFSQPISAYRHIGKVVWVKEDTDQAPPYAVGVEFTDTAPNDVAAWEKLVDQKINMKERQAAKTSHGELVAD
ncbi:MAG: PilZ domain-containing protein [Spartobacteria bacterium]|nr:PilZ domain-containing protein [Spartobacteria bacterium]